MELSDSGTSSRRNAAETFLRLVVAGKIREAYAKFVGPDMRHHNMSFAGDAASLQQAMEECYTQYPHMIIDIKRTMEDGDLVVVHSHIRMNREDKGIAAIHLFRFADERIVEEWEFTQPVPTGSLNMNGLF